MHTHRVLWVTDEVPDPGLGGGSIRQYHLLTRIATRVEVDLLLAGRLRDERLRRSLHRVIEIDRPSPRSRRYGWTRSRLAALPGLAPSEVALSAPVLRALHAALPPLAGYDVVQVEHEWLAPLVGRRSGRDGATRWMVTLHNLLSTRLLQSAEMASTRRVAWLLRRDAAHAARLEASIRNRYDRVLTVSEADAERLGGRLDVVPNGVDTDEFFVSELPTEPRLVFTGSWSWPPNADAAVWACQELLPRIRARLPGASLALVGREPSPRVRELESLDGVVTHFDVPSVTPFLAQARVALVPLWVGSGTRLKALEAMASGRPVVGTSIGLEGLGLVDGCTAGIADTVEGFSQRVVELCTDDARASSMAARARQLVESRFTWEAVAERYWQVFRTVAGGAPT